MRAEATSPARASSPHLFRRTNAAPVDAAVRTKGCLGQAAESDRRAALLESVYGEFDLKGSGQVGEAELLSWARQEWEEFGKARRRLGQMQDDEWTTKDHKELIRCSLDYKFKKIIKFNTTVLF